MGTYISRRLTPEMDITLTSLREALAVTISQVHFFTVISKSNYTPCIRIKLERQAEIYGVSYKKQFYNLYVYFVILVIQASELTEHLPQVRQFTADKPAVPRADYITSIGKKTTGRENHLTLGSDVIAWHSCVTVYPHDQNLVLVGVHKY